jgi:hypothetical protein
MRLRTVSALWSTLLAASILDLTSVVLDSTNSGITGIIGNEPPLAQTPLPDALRLFGVGFALFSFVGARKKRKPAAAT